MLQLTGPMEQADTMSELPPAKPISVGLTCWLWERGRGRAIVQLAQRLDVTVQLKQEIHGLHREIVAEVSGRNVDRFIGEFVRHC